MTNEPGIYVVTLNNELPISINAQDPRCADKVYKANNKNIKVGKAKSLKARRDNYFKTFGEENVNFLPIIITKEINEAEKIIMKQLEGFRVRNPISNRKTEWLIGINSDRAVKIAVENIAQSGIHYKLVKGVVVERNDTFQVREATEKDYKGICNLIVSEEELFMIYLNGKYPLTIDQLIDLSKVRKELTVLTDEGRIIGFANLYNYEKNKCAFIGNVVISKKYRGRGAGKEIVAYMLNIARDKYNLPEIKISVFSENTTALLLYSGFGFMPYEVEERKNHKGKRVALIHMKLSHIKNEI